MLQCKISSFFNSGTSRSIVGTHERQTTLCNSEHFPSAECGLGGPIPPQQKEVGNSSSWRSTSRVDEVGSRPPVQLSRPSARSALLCSAQLGFLILFVSRCRVRSSSPRHSHRLDPTDESLVCNLLRNFPVFPVMTLLNDMFV